MIDLCYFLDKNVVDYLFVRLILESKYFTLISLIVFIM